ncbi:hypothetical protein E2C01_036543 [Portunus trituberculatus]|uniref:Uncharacterized protein n=1 Tax=Portunus trituberculatus TaxID=210409 RepID=A0A5B7F5V4_PORTR|nr:hypothetical protein [Portunus trituberculatus]
MKEARSEDEEREDGGRNTWKRQLLREKQVEEDGATDVQEGNRCSRKGEERRAEERRTLSVQEEEEEEGRKKDKMTDRKMKKRRG